MRGTAGAPAFPGDRPALCRFPDREGGPRPAKPGTFHLPWNHCAGENRSIRASGQHAVAERAVSMKPLCRW